MAEYDEEAVAAFDTVREVVASMHLPLIRQRRYNGILNAIVMQVEDGHPSKDVIGHLRAAIFALLRFDGLAQYAHPLREAFEKFEARIASRML